MGARGRGASVARWQAPDEDETETESRVKVVSRARGVGPRGGVGRVWPGLEQRKGEFGQVCVAKVAALSCDSATKGGWEKMVIRGRLYSLEVSMGCHACAHAPTARDTPAWCGRRLASTGQDNRRLLGSSTRCVDCPSGVACACVTASRRALIALHLAARRANVRLRGKSERARRALGECALGVLSVVVRGAQAQALPSEIGLAALMHASQPPSPR